MASSIYAPLRAESREFRLLILEPSTDRLAPVRCKLNLASFGDGDVKYTALSYTWADPREKTPILVNVKYTALSYTWGDPRERTPILVNGVETQVTLNLEAALRHIRKSLFAVVLWVDALCINQKDEAEKNHQVEMMREIYSGAELVIAWLGSAGEDSDLAMEVLGKGWEAWSDGQVARLDSLIEDGMGCQGSSIVNDKPSEDSRASDYEGNLATPLTQNAAKILGETISGLQLSSPESPTDLEITGRLFEFLDDEHQDGARIIDHPGVASHNQRSNNSDSDVIDSSWDSAEVLSAVQRLTAREALALHRLLTRSWWSRIWVLQEVFLAKMLLFKCGDAEVSRDTMSGWNMAEILIVMAHAYYSDGTISDGEARPALELLNTLDDPTAGMDTAMDYLSSYGKREATRPHDHIYGLFGVMPPEDRMLLGAPDYDCRAEDLFISVVTKLMVEHNSLELLLETGIPPSLKETTSTKMDLPSWVPDWTQTGFSNADSAQSGSNLGSFSEPLFHFSEDLKELVLEGFEFDVIESVKTVPIYGQGKMPIWQADLTTKERASERELPPLHMLIVALFLRLSALERLDDEEGFEWAVAFFRELSEYCSFLGRPETADGYDNCDYLAGFLEWIGETRDERTDEEILEKIFSVEAARSFVKWYQRQDNVDLENFYFNYRIRRKGLLGNAGFSMFRTYKGSFGIMQAAAAAGDILCVVPSCWVMLALRKTQSSKYLLVGPSSQIAGTLDGEVAQAVERGEITKGSFTLV